MCKNVYTVLVFSAVRWQIKTLILPHLMVVGGKEGCGTSALLCISLALRLNLTCTTNPIVSTPHTAVPLLPPSPLLPLDQSALLWVSCCTRFFARYKAIFILSNSRIIMSLLSSLYRSGACSSTLKKTSNDVSLVLTFWLVFFFLLWKVVWFWRI